MEATPRGKRPACRSRKRAGSRCRLKRPFGWRLLRRYLDQQRGAVLLMALLLLASIALQLAGPQIVRGFIDAAQAGAGVLTRAALVFIGVSVAQQLLSALARYWSARVAWTATNELRADLSTHLMQLDLGFHTAHTPGELIERVDGDVSYPRLKRLGLSLAQQSMAHDTPDTRLKRLLPRRLAH